MIHHNFMSCRCIMWWQAQRNEPRRTQNVVRGFLELEGFIKATFLFCTAAQALPIDYDDYQVEGNSINTKDASNVDFLPSYDYQDNEANKRDPELFVGSQKRNIISALRAKIRRSKASDVIEDKLRFSPVLSVGEF